MKRFESNNLKACCFKSIHCYIVHLWLLKYQKWCSGASIQSSSSWEILPRTLTSLCLCPGKAWCLFGQSEGSTVAGEKPYNYTPSYLTHPNPALPLYLEVVHSSVAQFTGNKVIKLFTFGTSVEARVWGSAAKSHNSLITLYMYAIMSFNTILSCISKIGYPPLQPHKGRSFNGKARPTVYKSIRKSPTFLKSATSEKAVSTDPSCVYLQGLRN